MNRLRNLQQRQRRPCSINSRCNLTSSQNNPNSQGNTNPRDRCQCNISNRPSLQLNRNPLNLSNSTASRSQRLSRLLPVGFREESQLRLPWPMRRRLVLRQ